MIKIPAQYTDGQTPESHDVTLTVEARVVSFTASPGHEIGSWDLDLVEMIDDLGGEVIRISNRGTPDARVTVSGKDECRLLRAAIPDLKSRERNPIPNLRKVAVGTVAILAVAGSLWAGFPYLVSGAAKLVPYSWEQKVGASAADNIAAFVHRISGEPGGTYCENPRAMRAIGVLVQRLEKASGLTRPLDIRVVNTNLVNAFALPGGHILVFDGLIQKSESVDEVAGVLAHEMAHIVHRHPTKAMIRGFELDIVARLLTGDPGTALAAGKTLAGLNYRRRDELEADKTAVATLNRLSISVDGLLGFFARNAKAQSKGTIWDYFSTHPPDRDRVTAIREAAQKGPTFPAVQMHDYTDMRSICVS